MPKLIEFNLACSSCGSEKTKIVRTFESLYVQCGECGLGRFNPALTDEYARSKSLSRKDAGRQVQAGK